MALANVTYTGDGTTINYTITFDYLDRTNIAVFVNGVDTTDVSSAYKFELTDDTHVDVTTLADAAVPAGAAIKIARITPTNSTATVFADGAVVRASALNANTNQLLYISQEVKDNDYNLNIPLYVEKIIEDNLPSVEEAMEDLKQAWQASQEAEERFKTILAKFIR